MAPIYLGKMVVPSSLRYIENLASCCVSVCLFKSDEMRESNLCKGCKLVLANLVGEVMDKIVEFHIFYSFGKLYKRRDMLTFLDAKHLYW